LAVKIQFVRSSKIAHAGISALVLDYKKRLSAFARVEESELKLESGRDKRNSQKFQDGIYTPGAGEILVLLDERGRLLTSKDVASKLQTWMDDPRIKTVTFLVGPPYGFDDATRGRAADTWSLSPLTLPSDFAWLVLWEQVYRGYTILKGMPYHHD
jgi:23S rRNA (pseudouridine1915-N3)-methyltransferase